MTTLKPALPRALSPYRGIESFRYIDRQIFSAREDETWDVLSNILIYRGVLLYGDSGSGKSSLINAGLIPVALKERLIPNRLRIQPRRGKEIKVERIPREIPDKPPYLPSIFIERGSDGDEALSLEISLEEFYERLELVRGSPIDEPCPLLIFDQFEEFITLFEEALRGGETPEAKLVQKEAPEVQQAILETLTRLLEDQLLRVKILFVFREDYLAKLDLLFEICPDLLDQYVRLLPPRVEEAEKIIRAPFANDELKSSFIEGSSGQGGKEIPQELAAAVAAQLQERSENGFINLSELQLVCRKLWESSDPVRFFREKNGDIQKILEGHWADVLIKLGDLYDPAIALLGHMVTSSNTRNIVSEHDLRNNEKDNFEPERIEKALEALIDRQLVRREPRHKIYFYEIASEFLVPWIQQKKAERLYEIEARRLAAEAEQKLQHAEKQKRNLRIGAGILGSLLVVAAVLAYYSIHLRNVAEGATAAAESAKRELTIEKDHSDLTINLMAQLSSKDAQERLSAVNELDKLVKNGTVQKEFVPVILAAVVNDKDQKVSSAASTLLPLLTQESSKGLTESIIKSAEQNEGLAGKLPARVYIQIANEGQRARADKMAATLRSLGVVVPVIWSVDSRHAPPTNQLRYPRSADGSESPSAIDDRNRILEQIKNTDGRAWSLIALPPSSSARAGHLEIWFAADKAEPGSDSTTEGKAKLTFSFLDDKGNQIDAKAFRATLTPAGKGTPITIISNSSLAPPGKYELSVQVQGYLPYNKAIEIREGPQQVLVQLVKTKLVPRPSRPYNK